MSELTAEVDAAEAGLDPERLARTDAHFARYVAADAACRAGCSRCAGTAAWRTWPAADPATSGRRGRLRPAP